MTHQGFFRHIVIREGTNTQQFLINLAVSDKNLKGKDIALWESFLALLESDELLHEKVNTFVLTYNNGLADIVRSQECVTKILW